MDQDDHGETLSMRMDQEGTANKNTTISLT
jgi:hypothetical protein